jgi:cytochrome c
MVPKSLWWLGLVLLLLWVASCSSFSRKAATGGTVQLEDDKQTGLDKQDGDAALRGWAKIQENDCPSCHARERKSVGPSYAAIAEKYEATDAVVKMLAGRIISGSVGTWGEIPMTGHPELSKQDAEQMVKFVFTIKN